MRVYLKIPAFGKKNIPVYPTEFLQLPINQNRESKNPALGEGLT